MVKYAQNELFSITDFTKQIGSVVSSIKEHSLEKIAILKNNKLEAVVISTDEYERLKALEDSVELAEHAQIYSMVKDRLDSPTPEYISSDDMMQAFNISSDDLK
jgi:PHD/YefM family antitoxin component YafN of YafNO toxin-antitoxin module